MTSRAFLWSVLVVTSVTALIVIIYFTQLQAGEFAAVTSAYAGVIQSTGHLSLPNMFSSSSSSWSWQSAETGEYYFPFPSLLETSLSYLMGVSFQTFTFVPVNIGFLLVWWLLAYELTKSLKFATFYFFGFYLFFRSNYFSQALIERSTFGWVYFGFFLLGLFKLVGEDSYGSRKVPWLPWLVLTIFSAISTMYTYYNTATYEVFVLAFITAYCLMRRIIGRKGLSDKVWASLLSLLAVTVFFYSYVTAIGIRYGAYIAFQSVYQYLSSLERSFVGSFLTSLGLSNYYYSYSLYSFPLPSWLNSLLIVEKLAYLPIGVLILYWLFNAFRSWHGGSSECLKIQLEHMLAITSIAMFFASLMTYGATEQGNVFIVLSTLGAILLYTLFWKRGPSKAFTNSYTRYKKAVGVLSIALIFLGGSISLTEDCLYGWNGVYAFNLSTSLSAPIWYATYSTSTDIAVSNGQLDSFALVWQSNSMVEQYLYGISELYSGLINHNSSELYSGFIGPVNVIMYSSIDTRMMVDGGTSYTPPLPYDSWFYSLPTTNLVYNNGQSFIVYI